MNPAVVIRGDQTMVSNDFGELSDIYSFYIYLFFSTLCYLEEFLGFGDFVPQLSGRAAEGTTGQNGNFLKTQTHIQK